MHVTKVILMVQKKHVKKIQHFLYLVCSCPILYLWGSPRIPLLLGQFSAMGDLVSQGQLAISKDVSGRHSWRVLVHLMGRVQVFCSVSHNTQGSPFHPRLSCPKCQQSCGWESLSQGCTLLSTSHIVLGQNLLCTQLAHANLVRKPWRVEYLIHNVIPLAEETIHHGFL